jgi:NADPH-dependent glutamate synthase beta subunit-like oxidoreductase
VAVTPGLTAWVRLCARAPFRCTSSRSCLSPLPGHDPALPWLAWPRPLRSSAAHHEGGDRAWSVSTRRFLDDGHGRLAGLELADVTMNMEDGRPHFEVVPGSERVMEADLVLLALGFSGPSAPPCWTSSG